MTWHLPRKTRMKKRLCTFAILLGLIACTIQAQSQELTIYQLGGYQQATAKEIGSFSLKMRYLLMMSPVSVYAILQMICNVFSGNSFFRNIVWIQN